MITSQPRAKFEVVDPETSDFSTLQAVSTGPIARALLDRTLDHETDLFISRRAIASVVNPPLDISLLNFTEILSTLSSPESFFQKLSLAGLRHKSPLPLSGDVHSTLFVSAGVQTYEPWMESGSPAPAGRFFIAQPVARFQDRFSPRDGFHTTFINLCIEEAGCEPRQHFENLEAFLRVLEGDMGFESRGFTFERIGPLKQTWGGAEIQSKTLVIKHNGVELGEACYLFSAARNNRPGLVISDIGFGWERIAAAALAEDSHSCVPGRRNIDYRLPLTIQDSLRAAALIIGSGIQPSTKAQGYRVRSLVRHIVQENFAKGSDLTGSLDAFYGGWTTWAKMRLGPNAAREIFQKEELRAITHHVALHLFGEHDSHNIAKTTEAVRAELSEVLSRGRRESPRKIAQLIETSGGRYRTLLEEI